jgi:pimeloyl-ACP methyl ester carboxylesterase
MSLVQVQHSVTTPDGRTLTAREGGDPRGVPVLVHHGTPSSSLLYEPHVRDAEEHGIRLVSYDRPGYAGSTRQEGRSVGDCAADVAAVCDALGIGRFCTWGISGGGPHALATAALLPDRVAAVAALAAVAPYDAPGLDFLAGMGEQNVTEFTAVVEGGEAHAVNHERDVREMLAATPQSIVDALRTLLGPSDLDALTGDYAEFLVESTRVGIAPQDGGWFDDDLVFVNPWGFDLAAIGVPALCLQGEQDQFVPYAHGVWLSEHVPGVEPWLTAEDGHLTLFVRRVPEVHAWLLEHW